MNTAIGAKSRLRIAGAGVILSLALMAGLTGCMTTTDDLNKQFDEYNYQNSMDHYREEISRLYGIDLSLEQVKDLGWPREGLPKKTTIYDSIEINVGDSTKTITLVFDEDQWRFILATVSVEELPRVQ